MAEEVLLTFRDGKNTIGKGGVTAGSKNLEGNLEEKHKACSHYLYILPQPFLFKISYGSVNVEVQRAQVDIMATVSDVS